MGYNKMSKNVVLMTAVKVPGLEHRSEPYGYGINSWERWCKQHDCEFYVLDEALFSQEEMRINFHRYYALELLENEGIDYNQVLITDADSIIHPMCPNMFELTNQKYTVTMCDGNYDWICRSMENYAHEFDEFDEFDIWTYFNAGFQIFNKSHKPIIDTFIKFYWDNADKIRRMMKQYGVGTDQPLINHIIHAMDVDIQILPYRFCMADLHLKGLLNNFEFLKINGIYQFNAIPNNDDAKMTSYYMKGTHERLFN